MKKLFSGFFFVILISSLPGFSSCGSTPVKEEEPEITEEVLSQAEPVYEQTFQPAAPLLPAPVQSPPPGGAEISSGSGTSPAPATAPLSAAEIEGPEINLPPRQREIPDYIVNLPEPPPFEYPPLPDAQLAEENITQTNEIIFPDLSDLLSMGEAAEENLPDISGQTDSPMVQGQENRFFDPAMQDQTPPDPPVFLRIPERDITAVPQQGRLPQETPRIENVQPDPPVIRPNLEQEEIVFSRIIRILTGQSAEIPFRGQNWVFIGEIGSKRGLTLVSRKLDSEGQVYVFRGEIPEEYVLKFFRRDFIRNTETNDYVQVIVENPASAMERLPENITTAPRWPSVDNPNNLASSVPADPLITSSTDYISSSGAPSNAEIDPAGSDDSSIVTDAALLPQNNPVRELNEYVRMAQADYDAGRILPALSTLEELERNYPEMNDEALWLYARLLEEDSPNRDIRQALELYRRIVQDFPMSLRISDARQRIAYLQRFYFNIQ